MESNNAVASYGYVTGLRYDKCFFMIVGLMLFSMYFPYNHSIAIVYQIVALLVGSVARAEITVGDLLLS